MKKILRLTLFSLVLLSGFALLSCEISENDNLLFQLKNNLRASGIWQSGVGTDRFEFNSDGTFTYRIGAASGSGSFTYYETTSESIWDSRNQVGLFTLTAGSGTHSYPVYARYDGDLYFIDNHFSNNNGVNNNGVKYTQTK